MDARFAHEGKMRKRTRLRRMCSLCNESCRDPDEQIKHYSSTVHKHMKQIKQKQHSYTKNLKTLDEKIKASVAQNEALIGLEYIYQYAADKKGVIPYVCVLCDRVYKLDTIFFHIVGFKHRCLYLSKHFSALGIDLHFKARTLADCVKLLNASEVIEKCHGRKKINVSSTSFDLKKKGMKYDSDSGHEGLSSSEDEQNDPALTKPEWETIRSGAGDYNNRSVNQRVDVPFQHDRKSGPPLPNIDRGGPAFQYDDRREVQDGRRDMKRPLKDHDVSGFQHDGHSDRNFQEDDDRLPMELSYQHRGHDSRKVPGRTDFPGGSYPSSQMHRDGTAFHEDDLQGGPRQADNQVRNKDRDFTFQRDQYKRSLGNPHGDPNMPSLGSLPQQVDRDDVRSQNLQSHSGGAAFQYDVRQSGLRHTSDHGVLDVPSMGLLHQRVDHDLKSQNRTQSHPSGFYGDRNLQSQMHQIGMGFPKDERQGPILQGGSMHTESQVRNNDRDFAFQHDQSTRSLDLDMPPMGPLRQQVDRDGVGGPSRIQNLPPKLPGVHDLGFESDRDRMAYRYGEHDFSLRGDQKADDVKPHNRTLNHPSDFLGDRNFQSPIPRGQIGLQYDDRRGPILKDGPRHNDDHLKNDSHAFASQHDQKARLLGSAHGDLDMPSLRLPHQPVDRDALNGQNRTQSRFLGFSADPNFSSRMQRDGKAFQYDDREGPTLQGGPRPTDKQVRNDGRDFSFGHDQRRLGNAQGDLDMPSMGLSHQQRDYDDVRGFPGDHQKDRPLHNVLGDLDFPSVKSFYPQGDHREFGERSGTENSRPGFSDDRSLYSQAQQGGMVHDGRSNVDGTRFQMRGELITFQELKAAHEAGVSLGPSGMEEQDANDDSDMEVRSMDLSDCDPDQFLCNSELFEFVRTFKIQSREDEQFASKVKDLFTNGSIRYRKQKEESLKMRIAKEKEKLEEEKKAFLEMQKKRERPLKKPQQPSTTAPNNNQVPAPSSSSISMFPFTTATSITGLAIKPIPLMSLVIGHHTEPESNLQNSPSYPGQKGSMTESKPLAMPSMNIPSERPSRWAPESTQTLSEMRLKERSNQGSERGDIFPSRGRNEGARNLPPRFTAYTGSMKY